MRNQSRPSLAACRRGPSSPEDMEEDPGGAIIAMKAKDQRENLSPSRGRCYLLSTVLVFPEEEAMMQQSSISISLSF